MTTSAKQDLSAFSMLDLFRQETEAQTAILNENLLSLEQDPGNTERLAAMMRAAHSLKGAARIVNLNPAVKVAHALEDCFVAAQKGEIVIKPEAVDGLLSGVDMLTQIAGVPEAEAAGWQTGHQAVIDELVDRLAAIRSGIGISIPPGQLVLRSEGFTSQSSRDPAYKKCCRPGALTGRRKSFPASSGPYSITPKA
jgi:HPt (histidine-containing phosphotransfer) domain-containing protein